MEEENTELNELMSMAQESADSAMDSRSNLSNEEETTEELSVEELALKALEEEEEVEGEEEDTEESSEVEDDQDDDEELEEDEELESDEETEEEEDELLENDLDIEAEVNVKVDGKEETVKLKDLIENYSGKVAYDKKFTELQSEKESHEKRVESFNGNSQKFHELVTEGKAQEALDFLCEVAGLDKNRFVNTYVSQLAPTITEYLNLTPEQREQQRLEQETEYYKSQVQNMQKQQETSARAVKLREEIEGSLTKYDMDVNRFESLQKELNEFVKQGALKAEQITPEFVGQYHVAVVQEELATKVLSSIDPKLTKDKASFDYLISLQQNNPDMKEEDLIEKAQQLYADATTKKVASRVKKNSKATKAKKLGKKEAKASNPKALTFDEIDFDELTSLLD